MQLALLYPLSPHPPHQQAFFIPPRAQIVAARMALLPHIQNGLNPSAVYIVRFFCVGKGMCVGKEVFFDIAK